MLAQRARDQTFQEFQLPSHSCRHRVFAIPVIVVVVVVVIIPGPFAGGGDAALEVPLPEVGRCEVVGVEEE